MLFDEQVISLPKPTALPMADAERDRVTVIMPLGAGLDNPEGAGYARGTTSGKIGYWRTMSLESSLGPE